MKHGVDSNLTFSKCWQYENVNGIMTVENTSYRLIVMHIEPENGFLLGAELVFRAVLAMGSYLGSMN